MKYDIFEANMNDNLQLIQLMGVPMNGQISLAMERSPNYFYGLDVQGNSSQAFVLKDIALNKIIGVASCGLRRVFCDGKEIEINFLADNRILEEFRKNIFFSKGLKFFEAKLFDGKRPAYMLVLNDNHLALDLFLSPKMTKNRCIGNYQTPAIYLNKKPKIIKHNYEIRRAKKSDLENLNEFIQQEGSKKNLFPIYDLSRELSTSYCKGLTIEDYFIVIENNEIKACAAIWDQRSFKQTRVCAYSKSIALSRVIYNFYQKLRCGFVLPPVGSLLNYFHLYTPLSYDNNPIFFNALIHEIYKEYYRSEFSYFLVGFDLRDPLLKCFDEFEKRDMGAKVILNEVGANLEFDVNRLLYIESARL